MAREPLGIDQLEYRLLRRSVGVLRAERCTCGSCGRTPLIGEVVYAYEGPDGELLCELCRAGSRATPAAALAVRDFEHGQTVRALAPAA